MLHELHLDRTIVQANRYNGKYFTCSVQKNNCLMNRKRVHELRTRDVCLFLSSGKIIQEKAYSNVILMGCIAFEEMANGYWGATFLLLLLLLLFLHLNAVKINYSRFCSDGYLLSFQLRLFSANSRISNLFWPSFYMKNW